VIVRFSEAEHEAVAQRAAAARLAVGAWLGDLAVRSSSEPPSPASWREFVHELLLLRTELIEARRRVSGTPVGPSSLLRAGDRGPGGLVAIDGVLDRLDQLIESAGRRVVRRRL
jgi:hypothetical protein